MTDWANLIVAWVFLFVGSCMMFVPNRVATKVLLWLLGVQIVFGIISLSVAAAQIGTVQTDQLLLGLTGATIALSIILILAFVARR